MKKQILFCLLTLLLLPQLSFGWQGKVVGVSDGDTITVIHNGRGEKIRIYGVDCPEKRQDFGTKAKQFTSNMVFGKVVEVEPIDRWQLFPQEFSNFNKPGVFNEVPYVASVIFYLHKE